MSTVKAKFKLLFFNHDCQLNWRSEDIIHVDDKKVVDGKIRECHCELTVPNTCMILNVIVWFKRDSCGMKAIFGVVYYITYLKPSLNYETFGRSHISVAVIITRLYLEM